MSWGSFNLGQAKQWLTRKLRLASNTDVHVPTVLLVDEDGNAIGSTSNPLPAKGDGDSIQVSLSVTNGLYTIGDAVGGFVTLPNAVSVAGGKSLIASVKLAGPSSAVPYELWLFNGNIATPAADNAPMNLVANDLWKWLGTIDISGGYYKNSPNNLYVATITDQVLEVEAAAGTRDIGLYLKAAAVTNPGTTQILVTVDVVYVN